MTDKPTLPLDTPISDLDIPPRMRNALTSAGCRTLADALDVPEHELRRLRGMGPALIWGWRSFRRIHADLVQQREMADA